MTTLTGASAFLFSSWGIHLTLQSDNLAKWDSTPLRWQVIHSSLASYSWWICSTINWESLPISTFNAASAKASSRPTIIVSYSASLLNAGKSRRTDCSSGFPIKESSTSPTPASDTRDALFTCKIHQWLMVLVYTRFLGSSTIKSVRIWPFSDKCGLYCMSYSLNSIAHFIIRPDRSGLCKVTFNGWFVKIVTWCAWKHGRSFLVTTRNASVICSTWEYWVLMTTNALHSRRVFARFLGLVGIEQHWLNSLRQQDTCIVLLSHLDYLRCEVLRGSA